MNILQVSENVQLWDFQSQRWFLFRKSSPDFSSMSLSSSWLHVNLKLDAVALTLASTATWDTPVYIP